MMEAFVEDGALDTSDPPAAFDMHHEAGIAVLRGAASPEDLARALITVEARIASVRSAVAKHAKLDQENFSFMEVCGRGPGRLDIKLEEWPLKEEGWWREAVQLALGDDAKMMTCGVVVAAPGVKHQRWHADGAPLFPETGWCELPAHATTIFLPLVELTPTNGPTEYVPMTHMGSRNVLCGEEGFASLPAAAPSLAVGDATMFDYRVVHRGGANNSLRDRPVLYAAFGRSWYTDDYNFPSTRSVFDCPDLFPCLLEGTVFRFGAQRLERVDDDFETALTLGRSQACSGLRFRDYLKGPEAVVALCEEAGFEWVPAATFAHERHLRDAPLLVTNPATSLRTSAAAALKARRTASIEVRELPTIGGQFGVFADEALDTGTLVSEYGGLIHLTPSGCFDAYSMPYAETLNGETLALSARHFGNAARFVNHAPPPHANADFTRCSDSDPLLLPRVAIVTIRPIAKGEQIFVDYGQSYWRASPTPPIDLLEEETPNMRSLVV